jgi:2-oxoglutarate dehydrogenase E2 component (dihydrolipoamide succinyltransferase)
VDSHETHPDKPTADESPAEPEAQSEALATDETLSPAVRRLVKQYQLDVTGIHGTGPSGRIRVSDVMATLGSRAAPPPSEAAVQLDAGNDSSAGQHSAAHALVTPVTSVFECDMSAVLSHRKRMLAEKTDYLLTSYYLVACAAALRGVPEANGGSAVIDVAVALSAPGARTVMPVLQRADMLTLASVNDTLRAAHRAVGAGEYEADENVTGSFLLYHHGVTGSLLATPTPLAATHTASLGVGRVRRQVVVQNVSDQTGPRIAPLCYVSVSFRPDRLDIHRANQFLSLLVSRLERWPQAAVRT